MPFANSSAREPEFFSSTALSPSPEPLEYTSGAFTKIAFLQPSTIVTITIAWLVIRFNVALSALT